MNDYSRKWNQQIIQVNLKHYSQPSFMKELSKPLIIMHRTYLKDLLVGKTPETILIVEGTDMVVTDEA
mgnify:CR=1 FL=1